MQISIPSNPSPRFLMKNHEISISKQTKLDKQIKMNSRAMTRFNVDLLFNRPWHLFGGFSLMDDSQNEPTPKDHIIKRLQKMSSILQQEKYISSLIYKIEPKSPSEMALAISNLKHLKNVTSLSLEILPEKLFTSHFLKSLSITLSHLKNLTTLSISFSMSIRMTPELLKSLFFGLKRLKTLASFSLAAEYSYFDDGSLIALSSCVTQLTQLKSFSVNFTKGKALSDSVLSFLAPIFKKLTSLQNININLNQCIAVTIESILDFFTSLNDLKSLKSLALNLQGCSVRQAFTDYVSESLNTLLNASLLETLDLKYHAPTNEANLPELGIALQRFHLRNLTLDFADNWRITDEGFSQLASSLQALHELTSLNIHLSKTNLTNPMGVIGEAIRPLVKLKSLDLLFTQQKEIDDAQFSSLSSGLQGLTALKNLNLKLGDCKVTDKGFVALSKALKGLIRLSVLKLELWYIGSLTDKTIKSLSSAIGNLTQLTDLSLILAGNSMFTKKSLNSLGQAIEKLTYLTSISLDVSKWHSLKGDEDNFVTIFKALGQLKCLKRIYACLPYYQANVTASQIYTRHVPDQIIFRDMGLY